MMNPETLAAALRVAQHGARSAMLAARGHKPAEPAHQQAPIVASRGSHPADNTGPEKAA